MRKWLIRNDKNEILGPVSEKKLLEMINENKLTQSDEVCSGNGYWFHLSEQSLVDKYLGQKKTQGFNPISEAVTKSKPLPGELNTDEVAREDEKEKVDFALNTPIKAASTSGTILSRRNLLMLILTLMIIVIAMMIYRSNALQGLFSHNIINYVFPQAHAQEIGLKKNTSF